MTAPASETQDPRDRELADAHSVLAKETLQVLTARTLEIAREHPQEAPDILRPAEQFKYDIQVSLGGLLFIVVTIDFRNTNYYFLGMGGGLALGAQVTWGTAWLNYQIQDIIGWEARFEMNYLPVATNINLWGLHGETIGSIAAGGLGIGSGIVGGQGSFKSYRS